MITNQLLPSRISRLLPAALLACTMGLLPLGIVRAQSPDYDAVGSRLIKAVGAGELSPSQATAMMGALAGNHFAERMKAAFEKAHARKAHAAQGKKVTKHKKAAKSQKKSQVKSKRKSSPEAAAKAWLTKVKHDLGEMVKAGKISKADASKKYAAAVQGVNKKLAAAKKRSAKKSPAKKAPVKKAPVKSVRARQASENEKMKAHLGKLKKQLDAMVKAGKISKADAQKKFAAAVQNVKKKMAAGQARGVDQTRRRARAVEMQKQKASSDTARTYRDLERRVQALRDAVDSGRISHADARRKLAELKKKMGDTARKQSGRRQPAAKSASDARKKQLEAYRMRLTRAVENGRLSKEDAKRMMEEFIKKLTQARNAEEARRDAIRNRRRQSL